MEIAITYIVKFRNTPEPEETEESEAQENQMTRDCSKCGCAIPAERLEVIPDTETCVNCSSVSAVVGFMVPTANKGCAPEIHMVSPANSEAVRLAQRANRRNR